jgi:hypothetical protein
MIQRSGGTQSQLLWTTVHVFTNSNTISQSIDSNVKTINNSFKSIESLVLDLKSVKNELSSVLKISSDLKLIKYKLMETENNELKRELAQNREELVEMKTKVNECLQSFNP